MVSQNTTIGFDPINCFIQGIIETIGPEEFEKLCRCKPAINEGAASNIHPLRAQMDRVYGPTSATGIAICAGRAAFRHLLRQQESELGFNQDSYRFSPRGMKLEKGLRLLAKWMAANFNQQVDLTNEKDHWLVNISDGGKNDNVQTAGNLCDFTTGMLQEFMSWAGSGKFFLIKEVACRANGEKACCFRIGKTPIE